MVGLVGQGGAAGCLPVGEALPWRAVDGVSGRRQAHFPSPLDDEAAQAWVPVRVVRISGTAGCMPKDTRVERRPAAPSRHRVGISLEVPLRRARARPVRVSASSAVVSIVEVPRQRRSQPAGSPESARRGGQRARQDRRGIVPTCAPGLATVYMLKSQ